MLSKNSRTFSQTKIRSANSLVCGTDHGNGDRPLFSIGVTTYNRPKLLQQTLNSIFRQTYADFEVIVGNDFVDKPITAEQLGIDDARLRIVNHTQNLGEIENMNTLLGLSRGRYFMWQFDDDLYAPCFLEAVYAAIIKFNKPTAILTSFSTIDHLHEPELSDISSGESCLINGGEMLAQYWRGDLKIMSHAGVYERLFLIDAGGVERLTDSLFGLFAEYLLLIRTGLLEKVVFIDAPLAVYRVHEGSWGSTNRDLELMHQACRNLTRKGLTLMAERPLNGHFSLHSGALLKLCIKNYLWKCRLRDGTINRVRAIPLWFALGQDLSVVKSWISYFQAVRSWLWVGIKQIGWPLVRSLPTHMQSKNASKWRSYLKVGFPK